jgi:hypothetical protein
LVVGQSGAPSHLVTNLDALVHNTPGLLRLAPYQTATLRIHRTMAGSVSVGGAVHARTGICFGTFTVNETGCESDYLTNAAVTYRNEDSSRRF